MKTISQIRRNIKVAQWSIHSHKKQIEHYVNDEFDINKIEDYSRKIKLLQVEIDALKWVLFES